MQDMTKIFEATCTRCGRNTDTRPCRYCGGNIMKFDRGIVEPPVITSDIVQRTHEGIRSIRNYNAILAVVVIASFEGFVVLTTSATAMLAIHLLLSFSNIVAGYFAIIRNGNKLIMTFRKAFRLKNNDLSTTNETFRVCHNCNTKFKEFPCPTCGETNAGIIQVVNDGVQISENNTIVKENRFITLNYFGMIFFAIILGLQWVLSYSNGSIAHLTISILFALILFIPSYYMFFKIRFTDTEILT